MVKLSKSLMPQGRHSVYKVNFVARYQVLEDAKMPCFPELRVVLGAFNYPDVAVFQMERIFY
jgi:hypothetical protein